MNRISFYGGGSESAGSVADRQTITAKQESAGGIGSRIYQQTEPEVKLQTLERDTVSFRGDDSDDQKSKSALGVLGTLAFSAAATIVGLACVKKYGLVEKLSDGKFKDLVKNVTEPCYKWCSYAKENTYDKIVKYFNSKKS